MDKNPTNLTMTPRERVLSACAHRQPDRTPMDFGGTAMSMCTSQFLAKMREVLGFQLPPDADPDGAFVDEAIQRHLNVDLRLVPWGPPPAVLRDLDPKAYRGLMEGRERYKRVADRGIKTTAVSHNHPYASLTVEEIRKLKPEHVEPPKHLDWIINTAKDYRRAGYATTYWVSGGFFEAGCGTRGYELFSINILDDTDIVYALFDKWLPEKLALVDAVIKPLAPYVDWFCFGDDLGMQTGPFMSPATFREVVKPYMAEYYGKVREAAPDSLIFHHSCGSVYRLLDDLIDIGVRILNPLQPNALEMEPERLKEKARGRLCLHGGMDLQHLLPFGTPAEVRAEALRRMRIMGEGGGYVCAAAHSLPEDVPVENILALFGR